MKDINEDISGEDHEESGQVLKGEISTVISIAEYACYKSCKNKVVSEAALKRQGVEEEERQAVCAKCEKRHREEIQQFLLALGRRMVYLNKFEGYANFQR